MLSYENCVFQVRYHREEEEEEEPTPATMMFN
jgi:hypothetical protein